MQNLDAKTIDVLLAGNTIYLETVEGKLGHVFYSADGTAYMHHFEHGLLTGPWTHTPTGYKVVWDKVGAIEWSLRQKPGEIAYFDGKDEKRARVVKWMAGDAEGLAA